eukprot:CAMPEP_0183716960 /NCGR_PEP_ID=MMETSP0737-20130205/10692_1 /TAXON_ID=385413 /ORGANISM="Thalassiosira miniscula, Strain CCMP1093" /LENGTH=134 /DNA_ID=CAMNT_0025946299 /DNA_START=593 /DNA_END=994 /DNA_ORIENTATION=+
MEHLVSPAPESFSVLHSAISKINDDAECFDGCIFGDDVGSLLNDLRALSAFLVKPDCAIELYSEAGMLKWRLIRSANSKLDVIHSFDRIQECKTELYHENNALQLSRMALDLATKTLGDPQILSKINYVALQAE